VSDPRHVEWERLDVEPIRHRLATHYNATDVEQEAEDVSALLAEVDRLREERDALLSLVAQYQHHQKVGLGNV